MRTLTWAIAALCAAASAAAEPPEDRITPKGHWLAEQLASMDVENKWIAGARIDWRTGLPSGAPETGRGAHTHCSAFVAAAAKKLGVYILRPPRHPQELLANAQNEWLATEGADAGWVPLAGPEEARDEANLGELVVAGYRNPRADRPGHIAIVLPSNQSAAEIAEAGPNVMQAATFNSASIRLAAGFSGHAHAWENREIRYWAHPIERLPAAADPDATR